MQTIVKKETSKPETTKDCFHLNDGSNINFRFRIKVPLVTDIPVIPVITVTRLLDEKGKAVLEYIPKCNGKTAESADVPWYKLDLTGTPGKYLFFETIFIVNQRLIDIQQIEKYLKSCHVSWALKGVLGKATVYETWDTIGLSASKTEVHVRKTVTIIELFQ